MELRCVNIDKNKFDKDGLVPMVVQDANTGEVLSLFYANEESIKKMNETGYVWRYSREQKKVVQKGEISGNTQRVLSISMDCDRDALLALVSPEGPACHKGTASCFEKSEPLLSELVSVIKGRKKSGSSYTSKIVRAKGAIIEKLREECEELIEAKSEKDITWEAADLLYFMLVYLENRQVGFYQVLKELRNRRGQR
ncbi:phosphoribosyl-ATP diphosphatase [Candidatus Micrarchaeota archaeon]|nr:phosphoribosyl-ATP diphosphatase [Candidatus Micrarchaeota archaeon]